MRAALRAAACLGVLAAVAEGRGNRRRSGKNSKTKGKKRKQRRPGDKKGPADEEDDAGVEKDAPWGAAGNWRRGRRRTKPEEAIAKCGGRAPLPPERFGGGPSPEAENQDPEAWRYLLLPAGGRPGTGAVLQEVARTTAREARCRDLFAGGAPPLSAADGRSVLTCVLAAEQDAEEDGIRERALFASDYNVERGLPNYVAYVLPGAPNGGPAAGAEEPVSAAPAFDAAYAPGSPAECCWCAEGRDGAESRAVDFWCGEAVGARGHLAPLSTFALAHRAAANVFLNTVPVRTPFLELQWARKVQELFRQGEALATISPGRRLHLLMGPSLQSDGRLPSRTPLDPEGGQAGGNRTVEVPSFLWAASADPYSFSASGHFCRNGGLDDGCACVEGISSLEIEQRLGFQLFPGMHPVPVEHPYSQPRAAPRSTLTFLWAFGSVLAVIVFVVCCVAVCTTSGRSDKEYGAYRRAKLATAAAKKQASSWRKRMEQHAGGKEALNARFKTI